MEKTKKTKGCKKSKQRMTVTFIIASDGSFVFELIVIWRSKRPRCFKSLEDPWRPMSVNYFFNTNTAQKMKFSIKDFFSKCNQIRRKLRIWFHLLKKSLMENFIFCAVKCLDGLRHHGERLDRKMWLEKRKDVIFRGNVAYHPETLQTNLKNIKHVFLPKNGTSWLQPLDTAIIRNLKHYRKLLVRYVVSRIAGG